MWKGSLFLFEAIEKGYHLLWKVYERGTYFAKNGTWKGKGLHLGAEPPRITLYFVGCLDYPGGSTSILQSTLSYATTLGEVVSCEEKGKINKISKNRIDQLLSAKFTQTDNAIFFKTIFF